MLHDHVEKYYTKSWKKYQQIAASFSPKYRQHLTVQGTDYGSFADKVLSQHFETDQTDQKIVDLEHYLRHGTLYRKSESQTQRQLTCQQTEGMKLILEEAAQALLTSNFVLASEVFKNGIIVAQNAVEKANIKYLEAMCLLMTKTLNDVKIGFAVMQSLREFQSQLWFQDNFPAMFYGYAKYHKVMKVKFDPSYFSVTTKVGNTVPNWPLGQDEVFREIFPESQNFSNAMKELEQEWQADRSPLATCRYQDCKRIHEKLEQSSLLQWSATIFPDDCDYKG